MVTGSPGNGVRAGAEFGERIGQKQGTAVDLEFAMQDAHPVERWHQSLLPGIESGSVESDGTGGWAKRSDRAQPADVRTLCDPGVSDYVVRILSPSALSE